MPIGSENSPSSGARGPISRRKVIATIRSASVHISIEPAISSNGSSIRSSIVVGSRPGTTNSQRITLPLSNSRRSGCGCVLMSPRPNSGVAGINDKSQIVGDYTDVSGDHLGFLYSHGSYTTINFPGAVNTSASAINNAGDIIGHYQDSANGPQYGFLYSHGT